jgi:CBS-domain-containing membrane protein
MLAQHQLDRLLVVEEGDRLVGIISKADLRSDEVPWPDAALTISAVATARLSTSGQQGCGNGGRSLSGRRALVRS